MANTIERKIYFYKVAPRLQPSGVPYAADLPAGLKEVKGQPFTLDGRYLDEDDGTSRLCCWPEHLQSPQRARLARIRRRDWPQFEDHGELQPLAAPTTTAGLAESTHFVVFDDGIVGIEFNFHGPRPTRIPFYMMEKSAAAGRFELQPLLRFDVTEQLDQLRDVRAFAIRTPTSYASVLRRFSEDLGAAIDGLAAFGKAEVIDIVLKPRGRKKGLSNKLITVAKRVAGLSDARTELGRFVLRGMSDATGKVEEVDVLSDFLISKKRVVTQDDQTRAVASDSAYAAIREAHTELQGELRDAAGHRPSD